MRRTIALLLSSMPVTACGAGGAAETIRPKEATAAEALGEAPCRDVTRGGEPLVVDWTPDQRGDLEIAMKEGVAILRYDCKGIQLLTECRLDGQYGYMGMTRKEQVVRLENEDEARANLPLTGGAVGGSMERGATLDIAMVLVGKRRTTWSEPTLTDLSGKCEGATHYVKGASVGAFALATGTRAAVRASAEIFAAGASAASASSKEARNRDGDPADCNNATPDSTSPPAQCGAPVRLVLAPITKAAPGVAEAPPATTPEVTEGACPTGLVRVAGKCATPAAEAPHRCGPGDRADCQTQCDKGETESCAELGAILARAGEGDPALAPLEKACTAGVARGCAIAGELLFPRDAARAKPLLAQACSGGEARGCTVLGKLIASTEAERAAQLFDAGCNGGDPEGCAEAGSRALNAEGGKRDLMRAKDLLGRACNGGQARSCAEIGELYEVGDPALPRQPILAEMSLRRGCYRGNADACVGLGRVLLTKPGAQPSPEARSSLERGCATRAALGCAALKVAFGEQRAVIADPVTKQSLMTACTRGNARACANSALLDAAMGNTAMAKPTLQRACTMGDAWGCYLSKQVK